MKTAIGFRPEYLDFERGIRVGNLEERERITRILKLELEERYGEEFVTERWGRGVYWQWIGYLARANRAAKPVSNKVSFGCAKFYLSMNTERRVFECGMQVERGYVKAPPDFAHCQLASDWDWNRLVRALRPKSRLDRELGRLAKEGFQVRGGLWKAEAGFSSAGKLRKALETTPGNEWAGFQLFYPMAEEDVRSAMGADLVEAMLAVFQEVTPAMNLTMDTELTLRAESD